MFVDYRKALRSGDSVKYVIDDAVIDYIKCQQLYSTELPIYSMEEPHLPGANVSSPSSTG